MQGKKNGARRQALGRAGPVAAGTARAIDLGVMGRAQDGRTARFNCDTKTSPRLPVVV